LSGVREVRRTAAPSQLRRPAVGMILAVALDPEPITAADV
jgi:hypothetical protein